MRREVLRFLQERFGIPPEAFEGLEFTYTQKAVWVSTPEAALDFGFIQRRGIRLLRVYKGRFRITTAGAMLFGRWIKKNKVEVPEELALKFMAGEDIKVEAEGLEPGQVVVFWEGFAVGTGLYKDGVIKNQVPMGRRLPPG